MKKFGAELKRHALTAISYMLPLVVASGLLIAIGNLMGGEVVTDLSKMTIPSALTSLGVLGMGLLPSFIAGYISYSIADRPSWELDSWVVWSEVTLSVISHCSSESI